MKHTRSLLALALVWSSLSAPALASTMPHADFARNTLALGLGNGISGSADFPLNRDWMLGAGANFSYLGMTGASLDVHALYKILRGTGDAGRLDLDLMGGVQGSGFGTLRFDPFIGVALAYPFTPRLTGRLNIAVGLPGAGLLGGWGVAPAGIELGYRFTPRLEGTIGYNGRGDVLGLDFVF